MNRHERRAANANLPKGTPGKRVCIVFVETTERDANGDAGFNVFLEGTEGMKGKKDEELSPAEFWALKCFAIVGNVLRQSGAAVSAGKVD
jgi:hypothetical protein